jgi:hypothetical protein
VGGADAEVVHAAGAAEAGLAEAVEVVVTDLIVRIAALSGWGGFDGGEMGVGWGGASGAQDVAGGDHTLAGDAAVGAAGEQVAGVVIKPVDDLHTGAVG